MSLDTELTVSTMDTLALLECLLDNGVKSEEIRAKSGIDVSVMTRSEFEVSLDGLLVLWKLAEEVTQDPAIGIHLRNRYGGNHVHFVNYIAMYSRTVGDALRHYTQYGRLFCQAFNYELIETDNDIRCSVDIKSAAHQNGWIPEFHLSLHIYIARISGIDLNNFREVRFKHSCPTSLAEYETFFDAPVHFNAGENAVIADRQWLDTPLPTYNPHLLSILRKQADAALESLNQADSIARRVEDVILENLGSGMLDIEMAATRLNMHRSTLHRKLKESDTSFNELLLKIRKNLSTYYLNQEMKLDQIAYLLGYANTSGFQTAFKSWFGQTPGNFRRS